MKELYSAHPVMKDHPFGFLLAVILIAAFGLGLIILLIWHINNKSTKLVITEADVLYEQGLLSKERSELSIKSIRTVRVKQSFLNRIFGTGTVELYTAGDNPEIVAKGLPDPNTVRDIIKAND
ncbi:PH domain-containing protein [Gilvimarinus chinensis]|uniref:PH domain-containing protein n=1 Tax=Gilvimarinus chinensis TaxID=396005 RepID=UPI00036CC1EA|nr:PH domain-containing protein [Gilvimarinus chinensis]